MHPPAIVAFFHGLARRTASALAVSASEAADEPAADDGTDHPETVIVEEAIEAVTAVADAVEGAVERTRSFGFPIDPEAETTRPQWPPLPAAVETQTERIETGAVEVARRLSALSSTGWGSDPSLLQDMRTAVVQVTRPLRELERLADEGGVRRRAQEEDRSEPSGGGAEGAGTP